MKIILAETGQDFEFNITSGSNSNNEHVYKINSYITNVTNTL